MERRYPLTFAATSLFALASLAPAIAHERRILPANHGSIQLVVGSHVEPGFEDSYNAVDVILSTYDGVCPGSSGTNLGQPIDVTGTASAADPDKINLKRNVSTILRQPAFEFKLGFAAFGLAG